MDRILGDATPFVALHQHGYLGRGLLMRAFGLTLLATGLILTIAFLVAGFWVSLPWSTGGWVLFSLGLAYAGACSVICSGRDRISPFSK
jgi:hypothetical protein